MSRSTTTTPDLWPDLPDTLTVRDLVDRGIRSRSQIHRDIAAGLLPAYRLGSRVLIRKQDLLALLEPVRAAG